ncbi:MAG: metallophosphoesterase [Candidatus Omnitrophica bacterium]|nr:metallophosphoesterase [Candidatus Omnitrophota bacterium]
MFGKVLLVLFVLLSFLAALLLSYSLFIEPYWLRLKDWEVILSPKDVALDGLTILFLSDLHLKGPLGRNEARVLEWAREYHPGIVVLGGDLLDQAEAADDVLEFVRHLPPDSKIYAVSGNWEHYFIKDIGDWKRKLAKHRVKLLTNQWVRLWVNGSSVVLSGINDATSGYADLNRAFADSPEGYRILLSHAPVIFDDPQMPEVNLVLAGHCHGGQVCVPGWGPLWLPRGCGRYVYGLFQKSGRLMYVTSGVGTAIRPVRLFARPEVVFIRFIRAS